MYCVSKQGVGRGPGWIVPGVDSARSGKGARVDSARVDSARVDSARGTLVLYFTLTVLYCKDLKSIYNYK